MLMASALAGLLWDRLGASFTFPAGAVFCELALVGLAWQANRAAVRATRSGEGGGCCESVGSGNIAGHQHRQMPGHETVPQQYRQQQTEAGGQTRSTTAPRRGG